MTCDFCFAENDATAQFCRECGAPIGKDGAEASDAAVYPELAKANLQRKQGDLEGARATCMTILRQYPNNVTTQVMLGDILCEKRDYASAVEWYEMALDVRPEDDAVRAKRDEAAAKVQTAEAKEQEDTLAIQKSPKTGLYIAGIALVVVGVAVGAFYLGRREQPAAESRPALVMNPDETPPPDVDSVAQNPAVEDPDAPVSSEPTVLPGPETSDDTARRTALSGMLPEGSRLRQLLVDPRGPHWTLVVEAAAADNTDEIALRLGAGALRMDGAPQSVTVRVHRAGQLELVAEMVKTDVDALGDQPPTSALLRAAWRKPGTDPAPAPTDPTPGQNAP